MVQSSQAWNQARLPTSCLASPVFQSHEIRAPVVTTRRPARLIRLFAARSRLVLHLDQAATTGDYWPAAGDTTLGLASVLLLFGALLVDVLFVLLGRPEFGAPITLPLSELGVPGVP